MSTLKPILNEQTVDVWSVPLVGRLPIDTHETVSVSEWERANRFHYARDRHRYLLRRIALRRILSRYLDIPSADVDYVTGKYGKPRLSGLGKESRISFNTSSSQDLAVVAVARFPLGVDVEVVRPFDNASDITSREFTADERESLGDDPDLSGFFEIWTRKEALVKAVGKGLAIELGLVDTGWPKREAVWQGWRVTSFPSIRETVGSIAFPAACHPVIQPHEFMLHGRPIDIPGRSLPVRSARIPC